MRTLVPLTLLLPLAGSDSPTLRLESGTTLRQEWTVASEKRVASSTLTVMGNDQDIGSGITVERTSKRAAVDAVEEAEDGVLSVLRRTYETVRKTVDYVGSEDVEGAEFTGAGETTSLLEGSEVVFRRDADAGTFDARFAEDSDGDDAWLEDLRVEAHLGWLAPAEEVAEGDTWEVEASAIACILEPLAGAMIEEDTDGPDVPEGGIAITAPRPWDVYDPAELEGEIVARWVATETEDDERLARIELEIDLEGTFDLSNALTEHADARGANEEFTRAEYERSIAGTLTVLWDLERDVPRSVDGELEGTEEFEVEWTLSADVAELELGASGESEDTIRIEATFSLE